MPQGWPGLGQSWCDWPTSLPKYLRLDFWSGVLDGAVHAHDLPVGAGMIGLGGAMLNAIAITETVEHVHAQPGCWTAPARGEIAKWIPLSVSTVWIL